jgi:peptide-methionine (S)-S-oxide reductase
VASCFFIVFQRFTIQHPASSIEYPESLAMKLKALILSLMSLFSAAATPLSAAEKSSSGTGPAAAGAGSKTEELVIGGGCFWCTEGAYLIVPGVTKVVSGYAGGHVENPTYEQICTKTTGHAEVIKISYDPAKVSTKDLLDLFWYVHDPTTLNRQGNDEGPQYRSTIMYANEEQKKLAEQSIKEHAKEFDAPIVTEVVPLKKFYPAEAYHQDFANKNPYQGYVCAVVKPKIEKMKQKLAEIAKKQAK